MKRIGSVFSYIKLGILIALLPYTYMVERETSEFAVSQIILDYRKIFISLAIVLAITGIIALVLIKKYLAQDTVILADEVETSYFSFKGIILRNILIGVISLIIALVLPIVFELHFDTVEWYSMAMKYLCFVGLLNSLDNILFILLVSFDCFKLRNRE